MSLFSDEGTKSGSDTFSVKLNMFFATDATALLLEQNCLKLQKYATANNPREIASFLSTQALRILPEPRDLIKLGLCKRMLQCTGIRSYADHTIPFNTHCCQTPQTSISVAKKSAALLTGDSAC